MTVVWNIAVGKFRDVDGTSYLFDSNVQVPPECTFEYELGRVHPYYSSNVARLSNSKAAGHGKCPRIQPTSLPSKGTVPALAKYNG